MADKKKTADKKAPAKKDNKVVKWLKEAKVEFKKVVWPTKKQVAHNTGIVLTVMAICAIFIGLVDAGLAELLRIVLSGGNA
mgnify:CR=1 FL=1